MARTMKELKLLRIRLDIPLVFVHKKLGVSTYYLTRYEEEILPCNESFCRRYEDLLNDCKDGKIPYETSEIVKRQYYHRVFDCVTKEETEKLKSAREKLGFSYQDVAKGISTKKSVYYSHENGVHGMPKDEYKAVMKYLGKVKWQKIFGKSQEANYESAGN